MVRTLLFGGSFNPIHLGHLRLAIEALEQHGFAEVWLLPNGTPPHREAYATPAQHRLEMTRLACAPDSRLQVCDYELRRSETSYTVDTVRALKRLHPGRRFSFLTGMDAASDSPWKDFAGLLGELELFLAAERPGYSFQALLGRWSPATVDERTAARVLRALDVPLHELSSRLIRQRVAQGRSALGWLPESVRSYMEEHRLYLPGQPAPPSPGRVGEKSG